MSLPSVSVIAASRHRPEALLRCLAALRLQDHPMIELVVVADPAAARRVAGLGWALKLVPFDEANLAAARNAGLDLAAGEVVALIDDDAVPEPGWARALAAPFADPRVDQAGGFVRGRNGISWQWRAMEVDGEGRDHPIAVAGGVSLHAGTALRAIKTQGTNAAFRRGALMEAGGFDPAYRFFLEDADANLRLAARGGLSAVVPGAEVQHCYAESLRRRADRAPRTLADFGASTALFLRRHAPGGVEAGLAECRAGQWRRLVRMMVEGLIEPRDLAALMATLEAGIAEGRARPLSVLMPRDGAEAPFVALGGTGPRPGQVLWGWAWQRAAMARQARAAAEAGEIVTVIALSPGIRPHWRRFDPAGFWWQEGGLWGRSAREGPSGRGPGLRQRVAREAAALPAGRPVASFCPALSPG
jgi:GT2 family glycosyltransferase